MVGYAQVWVTQNDPGGKEKWKMFRILSSEGVYLQVSHFKGSIKVSDPFLKFETSCPFHLETIILIPLSFLLDDRRRFGRRVSLCQSIQ